MTLGPPRRFVPICVRHPYGFIGGPLGYVESETATSPIIAEETMSDDQTNIGESIREADRAAAVAALALATLDAMEAMRRDGWLVVLKASPDYGRAWRCDAIRHDPPKSWPKTRQTSAIGTLHMSRPDRDNIDKAVLDCLYSEDSGIASGMIEKRWGLRDQLDIVIRFMA